MDRQNGEECRETLAQKHLQDLLQWNRIRRAPLQQKILAAAFDAASKAKQPTARYIAEAVYGRTEDDYVRALRSATRELRTKLDRFYLDHPESSVHFRLPENQYWIEIDFPPRGELPESVRRTPHSESSKGRWKRVTIIAAIVCALGLLGGLGFFHKPLEPANRIEITRNGIDVSSESGRHLRDLEEQLLRLVNSSSIDLRHSKLLLPAVVQASVLGSMRSSNTRIALATYDQFSADDTRLRLLDGSDGRLIDDIHLPFFPSGDPRPTALRPRLGSERIALSFALASLHAIELDGDGRKDEVLIGLSSRRDYPFQVLGLDYDGRWRVLVDYWNMGNAFAVPMPDQDGNGADEILIYGQNNDFQGAVATILNPVPGSRLRGRSPEGYRGKTLRVLENYPIVGLSFRFPSTHLAALQRGTMRDMVFAYEWNPRTSLLRFRIKDAGVDPMTGKPGLLRYSIDLDAPSALVEFESYDNYLRSFLTAIADGEMEDCCSIAPTGDLERYGRWLASNIEIYDASETRPSWHPREFSPPTDTSPW